MIVRLFLAIFRRLNQYSKKICRENKKKLPFIGIKLIRFLIQKWSWMKLLIEIIIFFLYFLIEFDLGKTDGKLHV